MSIVAAIGRSPLFAEFRPEELELFVGTARFLEVDEGHVFFEKGAENRSLFILCAGAVRVERRVGDEDVPLAVLEAGQTFGEMSIMGAGKVSATVTAIEKSAVVEVSRELLDTLRTEHPLLWGKLWHALALELKRRLTETNELVANYVDINRALLEDPSFRDYYSQL